MILYNKTDKRLLKEKLEAEDFKRITLSFYNFIAIENPQAYRDELYLRLNEMQVWEGFMWLQKVLMRKLVCRSLNTNVCTLYPTTCFY